MSLKLLRTMKADLFLLCRDTIFVRNQLQTDKVQQLSRKRGRLCAGSQGSRRILVLKQLTYLVLTN